MLPQIHGRVLSWKKLLRLLSNVFLKTSYGMDCSPWKVSTSLYKAVFINLGMNTKLIAIRMLNKPVVVKTKPGEQLLGETTDFQYERIQLEGFTLEECMAFFSQE